MSLSHVLATAAPAARRWRRAFDAFLRGWGGVVVKLAISVILIALVFRKVEGDQIAVRVSGQSAGWLVAAALTTLAQFLTLAVRWGVILRGLGVKTSWREILRSTYIGTFFNCWMLGTVGGDAARTVLLPRGSAGWAAIIHSVLFDRVATLAGIGIVVLPLILFNLGPMARSLPLLVSLGVVLMPFVGLAIIKLLAQRVGTRTGALFMRLVELSQAAQRLQDSPRRCVAILSVSAISQIILSLIPFCLARAMHVDVSPIDFLIVMPPVVLLVALPISAGGWGVREGAMVAGLIPCGVPAGAALLVSVEMGLLAALLSLPAGALWLHRHVLRPLRTETQPG
jgi:uncharacterized protein (TIRG00374 family)